MFNAWPIKELSIKKGEQAWIYLIWQYLWLQVILKVVLYLQACKYRPVKLSLHWVQDVIIYSKSDVLNHSYVFCFFADTWLCEQES